MATRSYPNERDMPAPAMVLCRFRMVGYKTYFLGRYNPKTKRVECEHADSKIDARCIRGWLPCEEKSR